MPCVTGARVVSEPPETFVSCLWRDVENDGDLPPGRSPVNGLSDRGLGEVFQFAYLDGQVPDGSQGVVSVNLIHAINSG